MKKFKKTVAILTSLCMLGMTGCGKEMTIEQKNITIEVVTLKEGLEFWETLDSGAKAAGEELGVKIICEAPEEENAEKQAEIVKNAVKNKVDAIVLAPSSATDLNEAIQSARNAGIEVITVYSEVEFDDVSTLISTDNIDAGEIGARNLSELIENKGEIAIIKASTDKGNKAREDRVNGFKNYITDDCKDIKIVDERSCANKVDEAAEAVMQCFKNNPNIKGIYTTNQSLTEGACQAVKQLETENKIAKDQIRIVGWNASLTEVEYIKDGILDGTLVQNPFLYGYLGVRNAYKAFNGELIDSYINTGVSYVNLDNLNDDNIQVLVYPESD